MAAPRLFLIATTEPVPFNSGAGWPSLACSAVTLCCKTSICS